MSFCVRHLRAQLWFWRPAATRGNRHFETIDRLDKVVGERCVALMEQRDTIRDSTLFHWWPR